jgi:hypothetical protein
VSDNTEVNFTVQFNSDGNVGQTVINVPGPDDPEIEDSGTKKIGTGRTLRGDTTIIVTDVVNLAPAVAKIEIQYKINGQPFHLHTNLKSEEERPIIILFIKFPKL